MTPTKPSSPETKPSWVITPVKDVFPTRGTPGSPAAMASSKAFWSYCTPLYTNAIFAFSTSFTFCTASFAANAAFPFVLVPVCAFNISPYLHPYRPIGVSERPDAGRTIQVILWLYHNSEFSARQYRPFYNENLRFHNAEQFELLLFFQGVSGLRNYLEI